jgi:hypothetical protein
VDDWFEAHGRIVYRVEVEGFRLATVWKRDPGARAGD